MTRKEPSGYVAGQRDMRERAAERIQQLYDNRKKGRRHPLARWVSWWQDEIRNLQVLDKAANPPREALEWLRKNASKAGKASAAKMTAEERSARARKAAKASGIARGKKVVADETSSKV